MSCGHIDVVRAEKGPPGVGTKSEPDEVYWGVAEMLISSPPELSTSSSSSDRVSTETKSHIFNSAVKYRKFQFSTKILIFKFTIVYIMFSHIYIIRFFSGVMCCWLQIISYFRFVYSWLKVATVTYFSTWVHQSICKWQNRVLEI